LFFSGDFVETIRRKQEMKAASAVIPYASWTAFGKSDIGSVRETNEDRFYFDTGKAFFFVIDGMGGQQACEMAAEIACSPIRKRLERGCGNLPERIREAITLANNDIFRHASANPDCSEMACVATVAPVERDRRRRAGRRFAALSADK
jgi:serine/threonine protein phosphatase PrpC